jgi:hypothetical protein
MENGRSNVSRRGSGTRVANQLPELADDSQIFTPPRHGNTKKSTGRSAINSYYGKTESLHYDHEESLLWKEHIIDRLVLMMMVLLLLLLLLLFKTVFMHVGCMYVCMSMCVYIMCIRLDTKDINNNKHYVICVCHTTTTTTTTANYYYYYYTGARSTSLLNTGQTVKKANSCFGSSPYWLGQYAVWLLFVYLFLCEPCLLGNLSSSMI